MTQQAHWTPARLDLLRAEMAARGLSAFIVPRFDAHQGEYIAPHDERLRYVTGFSGSAGVAIVLADRIVLFVDGRYQVQARGETDPAHVEIAHFHEDPLERWLATHAQKDWRIGFNPMLVPATWHGAWEAALAETGATLAPQAEDPVDAIWADQPAPPTVPVRPFTEGGESASEKRRRIGAELAAAGTDLLIETQPDNIAWLLNVRGGDVAFNPMPQSFLLLDSAGKSEWFVDARKLPNQLEDFELEGVSIADPTRFLSRLSERSAGLTVQADPGFSPLAAGQAAGSGGGTLVHRPSPVTLAKARKNPVELAGFRDCHVEDGVALTQFMAWLHAEAPRRAAAGQPIDEIEAEERVLAFRQGRPGFLEPSFRTISAAGANAAMSHYAASPDSAAPITATAPYLLDSGGQYTTGTTDVTRTTAIGPMPDDIRRAYTGVLKGFISMMSLQFPEGTCGHQIDGFARRALWDMGMDYDHGTGHGVGHVLSVHEHPQRFSRFVNAVPLVAGMVVTIEPGHYVEGYYGMRVENQVEIVSGAPGYLRFETLTLAPIDTALCIPEALSDQEKAWLNAYHQRVQARLSPMLDPETRDWLDQATRPIS